MEATSISIGVRVGGVQKLIAIAEKKRLGLGLLLQLGLGGFSQSSTSHHRS